MKFRHFAIVFGFFLACDLARFGLSVVFGWETIKGFSIAGVILAMAFGVQIISWFFRNDAVYEESEQLTQTANQFTSLLKMEPYRVFTYTGRSFTFVEPNELYFHVDRLETLNQSNRRVLIALKISRRFVDVVAGEFYEAPFRKIRLGLMSIFMFLTLVFLGLKPLLLIGFFSFLLFWVVILPECLNPESPIRLGGKNRGLAAFAVACHLTGDPMACFEEQERLQREWSKSRPSTELPDLREIKRVCDQLMTDATIDVLNLRVLERVRQKAAKLVSTQAVEG